MNYRIKVEVKIEACEDNVNSTVVNSNNCFEQIINEPDAIDISAYEQALLSTNDPAIRQAIASHLSDISKKKLKNNHKEMSI